MKDENRTKSELIHELKSLRRKVKRIETAVQKKKQIVEALQGSEEEFKNAFNYSSTGISFTLPTGEMQVNQAFCDMVGFTKEELQRTTWKDITHPDDVELTQLEIEKLLSCKNEKVRFNKRYIHKNGSIVWVDLSSSIRRNAAGELLYFITSVIDITEGKRSEEELRESEAQYRNLFENSVMGISQALPDGRLIRANTAYAKMYGFTGPEEMISEAPHVGQLYVNPEIREEVLRILKANGVMVPKEIAVRRRDGSLFFVLVSAREIKDPNGKLQCYQAEHIEITERRRAEEALRESEEKYRTLVEKANEAISIAQDGVFTFVNSRMSTFLGVSVGDLEGKNFIDFVWPGDRELVMANYRKRSAGEFVKDSYDFRIIGAGGKLLWIFLSAAAIQWKGKPATLNLLTDITERKGTEEALKLSEEKYRDMVEQINEAIFSTDRKGIITYISPTIELLSGYKPEEMIGRFIGEFLDPLFLPNIKKQFQKVMAGSIEPTDYRVKIKSGELRWVRSSSRSIMKENRTVGMRGALTDITERKRTEEALRRSEEKWRSLVANSPDYIALHDRDGKYLFLNHYAEGFTEKDVVGKRAYDFVSKESRENYSIVFEECIRTMTRQNLEYIALGDNAVMRTYESSFVPIAIDENEIDVLVIARDITERKRAQAAMRESKEMLESIFSSSPDSITVTDINGRIILCNQATAHVHGFSSTEQLIGKSFYELVAEQDRQRAQEGMKQVKMDGAVKDVPFIGLKGDSGKFAGELSVSILKDSSGRPNGFVGITKDITERKQAEEQLRYAKEQVERFNQHLTEAIENERARISREIHDELGQSLTALKIDMNWMQSHVIPKGEIETKLERMIDIVNSTIRNVQQIAADLRPDILEDLGLVPAIEWYCEEFEKRTGIRCETNLEEIQSSNAQINLALFRVTQEALTNVARYSHATMVEVKLRQTGYILILEIIDNGIGMDKEIIDSNKSLGILGMRERIRQFNGSIDISSYKPQGTEVSVQIRMEREQ
jgi:PAS domain S-box-containing protein